SGGPSRMSGSPSIKPRTIQVGVGVVVDTLVVRTVMVPAIFSLVGERIWWPGRPSAAPSPGAPDLPDSAESDHEPYPVAPARA
ncbi:MMPL family transporter, partial [Brachybacterium muris]|uniref:MMPL family transporter n=1 Tax=Brachybacterium muris TaxID=219301 RepID=UPI00223B75F9